MENIFTAPPPLKYKCRNMHLLSVYLSIIDRQKRNTKYGNSHQMAQWEAPNKTAFEFNVTITGVFHKRKGRGGGHYVLPHLSHFLMRVVSSESLNFS